MDAVKTVFPNDRLKGCSFHFRQAMMRKANEIGLKSAYSEKGSPVHSWLREVMGLVLLPAEFIPMAWQLLQTPPQCNHELTKNSPRTI